MSEISNHKTIVHVCEGSEGAQLCGHSACKLVTEHVPACRMGGGDYCTLCSTTTWTIRVWVIHRWEVIAHYRKNRLRSQSSRLNLEQRMISCVKLRKIQTALALLVHCLEGSLSWHCTPMNKQTRSSGCNKKQKSYEDSFRNHACAPFHWLLVTNKWPHKVPNWNTRLALTLGQMWTVQNIQTVQTSIWNHTEPLPDQRLRITKGWDGRACGSPNTHVDEAGEGTQLGWHSAWKLAGTIAPAHRRR